MTKPADADRAESQRDLIDNTDKRIDEAKAEKAKRGSTT